jgi:hypothetical protein
VPGAAMGACVLPPSPATTNRAWWTCNNVRVSDVNNIYKYFPYKG